MGRQRRVRPDVKVAFDTSEGTWMSVDVSPDGARIVFDLLGDIYVMPIGGIDGGAPATRSRAGRPGTCSRASARTASAIAFTSDRGGLRNIWVMDADGSEPAAGVAKEKCWVVNSPAWAPDGEFIFAPQALRVDAVARRRRDVDVPPQRRRRRAGHREGRATRRTWASRRSRPTAATSTSARTSRRARRSSTTRTRTPGSTRSSASTWRPGRERTDRRRRRRRDHAARLARRQVAGVHPARRHRQPAVRPQPRDRRRAADLRRARQGQQETWAIHGVYPQYAWTPDSQGARRLGRGQDLAGRLPAARRRGAPCRPVARFRSSRRSSRRSPRRCASRWRSRRIASPCACCAAPWSRRTGRAWSTARSASCGSARCPTARRGA